MAAQGWMCAGENPDPAVMTLKEREAGLKVQALRGRTDAPSAGTAGRIASLSVPIGGTLAGVIDEL